MQSSPVYLEFKIGSERIGNVIGPCELIPQEEHIVTSSDDESVGSLDDVRRGSPYSATHTRTLFCLLFYSLLEWLTCVSGGNVIMVYRCVVRGCGKIAAPGVRSLHKVPNDTILRNEWIRFVNKTRYNWNVSVSSRLCSEHFTPDCHDNLLAWQMGKARSLDLKPSAVPTIYPGEAGPSGVQGSSMSVDDIIREYDEETASRDTEHRCSGITEPVQEDSDHSSSDCEKSDAEDESEGKDECCMAALVLSPIGTHNRRYRVKRIPLAHHAAPCGSRRWPVLDSDYSRKRRQSRDDLDEVEVKDEPWEDEEKDKKSFEPHDVEMKENSDLSSSNWENNDVDVKEEPVESYVIEDKDENEAVFEVNDMKIKKEEMSGLGIEVQPMNTTCEGPSLSKNGSQSGSEIVEEAFLRQLQQVIQDGDYTPDQVFSASKTSLFWKRLPAQTFISKKEEFSTGFKARDDRFTLLLCANASGDLRLKPLVVHHMCKPKDLKVTSFQMLPVHWRFNRRASLTAMLFEDWFTNCAIPEISAYCKQKHLEEKALILVDSLHGHPEIINEIHPYIKVMFLPRDLFPSLQPPDQSVTTQFIQLYTKYLLQRMLILTEGGNENQVENFWKSFSIKEALFMIKDSWAAIATPSLHKLCRYIWPGKNPNFEGLPNNMKEIQEIRELANKIPGQGFADITDDNIRSHLGSHWEELSEEEMERQTKATREDDDQQETPIFSMPPTSELKSIMKLLYKTEQILIEREKNPSRLEQSLPHLKSVKAIYMDALRRREKRQSHFSM
ncbi:uncharacterized protein LOC122249769 [Penaeus japonicus]|uniref:uncharacterized protein LOC122249769 n=1 Tax=Penaeus japonicus TaxID=27405 RepID=UPI001C714D6A|nr:uncharacterized protein LOC122249769 [Penaeus japonicus]